MFSEGSRVAFFTLGILRSPFIGNTYLLPRVRCLIFLFLFLLLFFICKRFLRFPHSRYLPLQCCQSSPIWKYIQCRKQGSVILKVFITFFNSSKVALSKKAYISFLVSYIFGSFYQLKSPSLYPDPFRNFPVNLVHNNFQNSWFVGCGSGVQ